MHPEAVWEAMNEANAKLQSERDALRARVAELEKQLLEKDELLAAYEAVRWPKNGEEF